ncbi:hypothetical protein [Sphingopyxis sp.]|uniref:hypothetical protein n=1 Tax=Sphingopyxis sp. TaxID=1908224 RepID=UPI003D14189E
MRKTILLLAGAGALFATPVLAQVGGVVGGTAVIVDGGKLYNVPLAEIYSKADSVTGPLVTKLAKAEIRARVQGGAEATSR